jgi:hypothetical protein
MTGGDCAAGMRSGLNASPANRSIGMPDARASFSASMSRAKTLHSSIRVGEIRRLRSVFHELSCATELNCLLIKIRLILCGG